ncbi:MAG TPA: CARDB domain-containing protein, partial [bacterium]|nr:CARDB domain-containing protein [bacterium]
ARNVYVVFYDGNPAQGGVKFADGTFPVIPTGGQSLAQMNLGGFPKGTHHIYVVIDPENTIPERDENNNVAFNTFVVSALRDLSIASSDITFSPLAPRVGDTVTINATIHNAGSDPSDNVIIQFFVGSPEAGGVQIGSSVKIDRIVANGSGSAQAVWSNVPSSGVFSIYVKVDATESIDESNEDNNMAFRSLAIAEQVDIQLSADGITFSNNSPVEGDVVNIRAVVSNAGLNPASNVRVRFHDGEPGLVEQLWPIQTMGFVAGSAALVDVDQDSKVEVIIGSGDGNLYLLRGDGSNYPGWPVTLGGIVWSSPAVGDINGDAKLDIVVGCVDKKIYAYNLDGSLLSGWPKETNGAILSSPTLADVDGDGQLDVIIGTRGNALHVLKGDGNPVAGFPASVPSWIDSSPTVGDLDGDGQVEIAVGCY